MRIVAPLLFAVCATLPALAHAEVHYYLVDSIATQASKPEFRAEARELEKIYTDMARQSGVDAKLVFSTDPDVNAFATEIGKDKIVVVQAGLLSMMEDDRDAVAAVLGHELGHHKADHIRAGKRKQEGARVLGTLLGAVVGAKLGKGSGAIVGATAGSVGGSLVALKFNRDQEMEADRLSVGWMIAAGYNPDGMLRLQKHLSELEGHSKAAIFSTHPTSAKRYEAAQKQIAKAGAPPDLLSRPVEALVGSEALASAKAELQHAEEGRLAEALKPEGGPIAAAALVPVEKVDFDTYAALQNQMLYAGDKGKAKLLAQNHITETQLKVANNAFTQRMGESPALAQRFSAEYFRATQGKFADYGRDLADSYEKNQPLKLDPPYPLETAAQLFAEMRKRGTPNLDATQKAAAEREVLKPHGLTYYEFLIAHNWWSRKAKIAMVGGDSSIVRAYYGIGKKTTAEADEDGEGDEADAATANVQVGKNVHTGSNVRIGGKPVATQPAGR
jgi:Zn-dependent protease with chaperone function